MDVASTVAEHLSESGKIGIAILPLMFFISVFLLILFIILQILMSRKQVSYLGYIGCGLEIILSIVLVIFYISDMQKYTHEGQIIVYSIIMFLLFNIPTLILLIISILTNRKYKSRRNELEKINISDLE